MDGNHVQSIVKIFSQGPASHKFFRVPVCGGDDPRIYFDFFCVTYGPYFFFLEGPEKLYLHVRGHFGDLVQKDSSALCDPK